MNIYTLSLTFEKNFDCRFL